MRTCSRRALLRGGLALAGAIGLATLPDPRRGIGSRAAERTADSLSFASVQPDTADRLVIPPGYRVQVLVRWGDPLFPGTPEHDLDRQSGDLQARQFGFNCDFLALLPLPRESSSATEGLLWVNHESTDGALMFRDYVRSEPTQWQMEIEQAAHGASVFRVARQGDGQWAVDRESPYNRRITASTPMGLSGPAAGYPLLRTAADPSGRQVVGMLNNCGGGVTPWGTVLTAEEFFNGYFANAGALDGRTPLRVAHDRYNISRQGSWWGWEAYDERFDVRRHPNEPFRFGWMVEIDPYDPSFTPVKRTALGRFKHEAGQCVVSSDGRVVVYMGDDERFEHIYKFVSANRFDPADRAARLRRASLLDDGTLFTARFDAEGQGTWLPLEFGQGPLTPENGFHDQAEVLIKARLAADAVGATPMDRPEEVEVSPIDGRVYLALTKSHERGVPGKPGTDAANPRGPNPAGHIIELTENDGDHAATSFRWQIFLLGGEPSRTGTVLACPDNLAFDSRGNLWITTDGQKTVLGVNDGLFAVPTDGPERGIPRQFLSSVVGSEVTGPLFSPDERALFLSIQHPAGGSSLTQPSSRWPGGTPRPSVIVVTREDGGRIGS